MSRNSMNLSQLLDTFQLIDANKDGFISFEELRSACEKFQMTIDEDQLKTQFRHDDRISFDEFCLVMQDSSSQPIDAYCQETFRAFDKNSDGFITVKEIKQTMKELGEPLSDEQAKDMLKTADTNGDGKLSQAEFQILFDYLTNYTASTIKVDHK